MSNFFVVFVFLFYLTALSFFISLDLAIFLTKYTLHEREC